MVDIGHKIEAELKLRYKDWDGSEQFNGTGSRLQRMIEEMFWKTSKIEQEKEKCFKAVYPDQYSEMLVTGPTSVWTFCPHHILPCHFEVHIGYIPNGKVLGLSKFSRIALILAKRPIMQEQYSRELADAIMEGLKPRGVGVLVKGSHGCMGCRGVGQEVPVKTSVLKGCMLDENGARAEFLRMLDL